MSDWDAGGEPIPVERVGTSRAGAEAGDGTQPAPERDDADREDLAADIAELEATVRALREEVDGGETRGSPVRASERRDRPALPRPPTPREVLRFTETYTIPTVVAVLEASIRALELLGAMIRLLDGRDPRPAGRGNRLAEDLLSGLDGAAARDRAVETGQTALEQVDTALAELQRAYDGEPEDERARDLLADARTLRSEIDDRLRDLADGDPDDPEVEDEENEGAQVAVDVEAELETLRQDMGRDDAGQDGGTNGAGQNGGTDRARTKQDDDAGGDGSVPDT